MMNLRKLAMISAMAGVISICSWIAIPFAVPFTMQTFAVFSSLLILGGKGGTAAIGLYVALGAAGLPVFAGFQGGIGHILGPTGGYIAGFVLLGASYMLLEQAAAKSHMRKAAALAVGLLVCYLTGTVWFAAVYSAKGTSYRWLSILTICVFPYIVPDLLKLALAVRVSERVKKHIAAF